MVSISSGHSRGAARPRLRALTAACALANPKNRDIFRLYSWILVMPDGRPSDVKKGSATLTFGGKTYTCTIISGSNVVKGKPARFSQSHCPDFMWTNGPGRFYLTTPERDLVRSVVVGAGRQTPTELQRAPRCAPKSP